MSAEETEFRGRVTQIIAVEDPSWSGFLARVYDEISQQVMHIMMTTQSGLFEAAFVSNRPVNGRSYPMQQSEVPLMVWNEVTNINVRRARWVATATGEPETQPPPT